MFRSEPCLLIPLPGDIITGSGGTPLAPETCLRDVVGDGLSDVNICPDTPIALAPADEPFQQGPTSPFVTGGPSDLPSGATPTLTGEPITPTTVQPGGGGLQPLTPGLDGGVVGAIDTAAVASFVQTPAGAGIILIGAFLVLSFLRK